MSRLTDLLREVGKKDEALADELRREYERLSSRRSFGLNFERHVPESVELPDRKIRRGDKVRFRAPRGKSDKGLDQRMWLVTRLSGTGANRTAHLVEYRGGDQPETTTRLVDDLIVVAEFRDAIYPGLRSTGKVERGGDKPYHTVINGENYHALEALLFAYEGKVDAIYIDPPYNTRDKDWKYNNDYVDKDDVYRHSKWLAMMERRLKLAKRLLNPADSVLILTIDDNEYLRLGLLLEQTFPNASIQMCSVVINPSGTSGDLLSRVDEYVFFAFVGKAKPGRVSDNLLTEVSANQQPLIWESLLRRGNTWYRQSRPNLCYPVLIDPANGAIMGVGEPFAGEEESERVTEVDGCVAAWPVRTDGRLGIWRKDRKGLLELAERGYAYATKPDPRRGTWSLKYLMTGSVNAIDAGLIKVERSGDRSQVVATDGQSSGSIVKTVWYRPSHNAGMHGSALLRSLIPGRAFPYPKSLYAVEDALRIVLDEKSDAVVLDFFAGSGTTAHAVMRLNRQDGGRRRSIMVTNNEVSAEEQRTLRERGLRLGDPEWEALGICEYITKPRIRAAITGETPDGTPIRGDYRFTDEFPMAEGFEENAEFFDLTYEDPDRVRYDLAFSAIAPLLWMRAGSEGRRIDVRTATFDIAETYGVLFDVDAAGPFIAAVREAEGLRIAYIVTDDERQFQVIARELPDAVESVRLYESYLGTFRINTGDS